MTPILIQSLQLHDDFTTLLMNMIFAELIMALFGVPVNFTAAIQHGWKLGETFCHAHGFLLTLESKYKFSTLLSYSLSYSTFRKYIVNNLVVNISIEIRGIYPFDICIVKLIQYLICYFLYAIAYFYILHNNINA